MCVFHSIFKVTKSCTTLGAGKFGRASGMLCTQPEVYMRDRHPFRPPIKEYKMKSVSTKTASRNRRIDKIKRSMNDECFLCRRSGCDPAHILPKSGFGRYADKDWNIIPLCRYHHTLFDDDRHFRCQCLQIKHHVENGLPAIKDEGERAKLQMSINNHFSI